VSNTRHEVSATMANPTLDLRPISAQITLDEAWSPYARATLTCPIPPGTLITQIDPRQGDRVTIVVKRTNVQTQAVQTRTFDLGLRGSTIDYLNGTMTLDLAGDELRLQDFLRYETVYATLNPPFTGSLVTLVNWGLGIVFPGVTLAMGAIEASIDANKIVFKAGDSMWGLLDPFVRGAGLRLWCDEARIWHLDAPSTGAGGNFTIPGVTMMNHTLTREPWADAVVIENTWTDATGAIWTVAQSAYTSAAGGPTKGFILRNAASTVPSVAAAVQLYYRMQGRGRDLTAKAVSDYTVTPGRGVAMNVPNASYTGMVSSVSWDFPSDEMTITTRDRPAVLRAGDVLTALDTTYTPNPTDPPATAGPGAQPKELEP
jgi:hypothetical protein